MPSRPCHHPTCAEYVRPGVRYCPAHETAGAQVDRSQRRERDRHYDQHARDPEAKRFYNSAAWLRVRDEVLGDSPVCQRCNAAWSEHVHHRKPLAECAEAERLARDNLMAVCPPCHNILESEIRHVRHTA